MELYHSQLRAADIDYHVEPIPPPDCSIHAKIYAIRDLCRRFGEYQFIVFTDAFDVQFYGTKEEALSKMPRAGMLLGAEKNCHPYKDIIPRIPDTGPWRYANGGLWAGTPENQIAWCDEVEEHPLYSPGKVDQGLLNEFVAEGSPLGVIDSRTTLFFCLYMGYPELTVSDGVLLNTLYGTRPQFIHANGCADTKRLQEMMR